VQVALKVARIDYEDFLKTEASILARLARNPRIVKVFPLPGWSYPIYWTTDTIKLEGQRNERLCYMAMEYVEGVSLRKYLDQHGHANTSVTTGIARQIADGLNQIHSQSIVHLDIKPENILLRRHKTAWLGSSAPEVVLCDFGIARDLLSPARVERAGSPDYLAPEVLLEANPAHKVVSYPADVYMLGEVIYEMLTGLMPFDDPGQKIAGAAPHPLQAGNRQLNDIVVKSLARDPSLRYAHAGEMRHDLDVAPMPVDAGRVGRQVAIGLVAAGIIAGAIWAVSRLTITPPPPPNPTIVIPTVPPTPIVVWTATSSRLPTATPQPTHTPTRTLIPYTRTSTPAATPR
jgi:serine/threonine protein kinase